MTRQYLAGELSVRLARLQAVAVDEAAVRAVTCLRHEAETQPTTALGGVAARALDLADDLCWTSLGHGDMAAFSRLSAISADLYEFGICADLLHGS